MYKSSKSPYQSFIYFPLQGQPGRPGPSGESGSDGLPVSISHQYSGPKLFEGHVLDLVQVDSHYLAARLKAHTDRTRFGNATRIFNFPKQIKPSTDKIFTRYAGQIAKIALSGPEYLKNIEK
jgi:hypothetical protein